MGHNIFKEGFQGSRGSGRGPKYTAADTEGVEAAVRALSEDYIASMKASPENGEDTPILWWLCSVVAEAFAAKIPKDADGQQILDGVVSALKRDWPKEIVTGLNTLYFSRVVQALYLAGHNNLFLDLAEFPNSFEEFSYLEGTADEKLVLHAQGTFDSFKTMRYCHISLSGNVTEIDYCTDSRFDMYGTKMPWIKNDTRGCTFYFHDLDREGLKLNEQSLHNAYFVRDSKSGWERVGYKEAEEDEPRTG